MNIGYCLKCKKKMSIGRAKIEKLGKRKFMKGICVRCGTRISKII